MMLWRDVLLFAFLRSEFFALEIHQRVEIWFNAIQIIYTESHIDFNELS